ncbi:hypothetical protein [Methanococcoides sp. FTZ1]|uniref:hypothetical protein n=1 Tax=Methanococcoides sp. FTZ1 TaxID=3439061 RepID=UPI003F877C28
MTLKTLRKNIEDQLKAVVNAAPIKDVYVGDVDVPKGYPCVHIMPTGADEADQYSVDDLKGWVLSYDVSVMASGANGNQSFDDGCGYVDTVYNRLQRQQKRDRLLNGTVQDINVGKIEYGMVALDLAEPVMTYGGVIRLQIIAFEENIFS